MTMPWNEPMLWLTAGTSVLVSMFVLKQRASRRIRALEQEVREVHDQCEARRDALENERREVGRLLGVVAGLEKARSDVASIQEQLRAQFAAEASRALTTTSHQFLQLANTQMQTREQSLAAQLANRQSAIDATLQPLQQQLGKMTELTRELDSKRENAMGALVTRLGQLDSATTKLREQGQALTETLRGNVRVRGRWGEQTLRRLAELGGLQEQCDFVEQQGSSEGRPDMIVRMPDQGQVPIDAKAPLDRFLEAHECQDPAKRDQLLREHAEAVRGHIRALAKRDYPTQLGISLGFTVLFLPTEPMLAVAIEQLPDLFDEAQRQRILLATPMTLLAMLKTIAVFWHQQRMVENASQIVEVAREMYQRVATFQGHMEKVGKGLETAGEAFQEAVTSFNKRVVPQGRRLEELGGAAASKKQVAELAELTSVPRPTVIPMPTREVAS
jgi:DNA recombination protein RmuC